MEAAFQEAIHSRVQPEIAARIAFERRVERSLESMHAIHVAEAGVVRSIVNEMRETLRVAIRATDRCLLDLSARISVLEVLPGGRRSSIAADRTAHRHPEQISDVGTPDTPMLHSTAVGVAFSARPGTPRPPSPMRPSRRRVQASNPHQALSVSSPVTIAHRNPPNTPAPRQTPQPISQGAASDDIAELWEALEAVSESMRLIGHSLEEVRSELSARNNHT